jgi:hypothetical protein
MNPGDIQEQIFVKSIEDAAVDTADRGVGY